MTTTTKLIFLILLISAIFLFYSFTKPTTESKYATMRTVEATMGGISKIILVYDGKTEELELGKGSSSNQIPNTQQINQALNLIASKGYELVSQSGGDYISMYSFVKK